MIGDPFDACNAWSHATHEHWQDCQTDSTASFSGWANEEAQHDTHMAQHAYKVKVLLRATPLLIHSKGKNVKKETYRTKKSRAGKMQERKYRCHAKVM